MTTPRAIIVGSGVAGLATALELGDCIVITKTAIGDGSSRWAQGGIAAAIGADDRPHLHANDTVNVSGGLAARAVADLVAAAAPGRVGWLTRLGARFDRDATGVLTLGREAGHSRNRIVHADGDATGAELMRTLVSAALTRPDIEVRSRTQVVDLVFRNDAVAGVLTVDGNGRTAILESDAVILATGGIGRLYAATTNPVEVTGDGLAIAIRAGARIVDPEFVQFHPTALRSELDPMPLLTEALRGAGAVLVDGSGERFMTTEHPDAELAPRDVVARAIWRRLAAGGQVSIDATHLGDTFPKRFPTVYASTTAAGVDPVTDPIPVSPAAHYHMGGVATDPNGQTSLPGLYAAGEVASTGLHGANRLASNSLLEGLVFARRIAATVASRSPAPQGTLEVPDTVAVGLPSENTDAVEALRTTMWEHAGLVRTEKGLRTASQIISELTSRLGGSVTSRNMATVAAVVVQAALQRTESRGAHHRLDYPETDEQWRRHTVVDPAPVARAAAPHRGAA